MQQTNPSTLSIIWKVVWALLATIIGAMCAFPLILWIFICTGNWRATQKRIGILLRDELGGVILGKSRRPVKN